ncbi:MAG: hypothetical protein IJM43_08065 [Bacteroidaceae bacterium]|nr:hypothetical protein [Bacteroidaceae bacterium]
MKTLKLPKEPKPMPSHCELIMHPNHLEVVRTDGRTPTLSDIRQKNEWERYLRALAAIKRNRKTSLIY